MTADAVPLRTSDIQDAVDLWRLCALTRPWNDPHEDARRAIEGSSSAVLGLRRGGDLIATAMVGFDGHRAWVYYLAVREADRGAGLGRRLMRAAEGWAEAHGAPKLELMVRNENGAAIGFYEAMGYRREPVAVLSRALGARG